MLPRKEHIKMVNEFHDRVDEVSKELESLEKEHGPEVKDWNEDIKAKIFNLSSQYFELTSKVWSKLDDSLEYEVKHRIYVLKNEPSENWNQD